MDHRDTLGGAVLALLLLVTGASLVTRAEGVALDPPLKVVTYTIDKRQIAGQMTAYDHEGFTIKAANGQESHTPWADIDGRNVYLLHMRAFGPRPNAEQWFDLGRLLMDRKGADAEWSERAFREAVKLDADISERIKQAKDGADDPDAGGEAAAEPGSAPGGFEVPPPAAPADGLVDPTKHPVPENLKGKLWEAFTPEAHDALVERLKKDGEKVRETLGLKNLNLYETDHLLFYTDLDKAEALEWQRLIDKMYDRMLEMWAIPKDTNVWRGKAMVYIFKNRDDFVKYEVNIEKYNPGPDVAGLCHSGGFVRIAFYRQPDKMAFATVLVHETAHGFMHRYRSPVHPPSWIHEGIAEWIAYQLVPASSWKQGRISGARRVLTQNGSTGAMFDRPAIDGEQYGIAYTLIDFMIAQNKKGFVNFINAVKDGKPWQQALEEDYGVGLERLVAAYGQAMRIPKPVKP